MHSSVRGAVISCGASGTDGMKPHPANALLRRLDNGLRAIAVQDSDAVFAAACVNVNCGYFDDPDDMPGLAHFLEHAVHLGSAKFPDEREYKSFLSKHGGASNASTGMQHTQYHFKVASQQLGGALDRLAQFFVQPLLLQEPVLREVENVHAEFSRNCNSDSRKLMQLKRSTCQPPYSKFSTGSIATLRDAPLAAGMDVAARLRALWGARYGADAMCAAVVGPQPLDELETLLRGSFKDVRPHGSAPKRDWGWQVCLPSDLGLLYRVAPQRELRALELQWCLPFGKMRDSRCKPWSWVGHLLGHESKGSVAHHLKKAGLAQALHTGMADDASGPGGGGFMFWRCEVELTERGQQQVAYVVAAVHQGLQMICAMTAEQRLRSWQEVAQLHRLRFEYRDRQVPLDLARALALQLHYWPQEELLAGPALLQEYDGKAIKRFLAHLVPANLNVFWSGRQHAAGAQQQERWYGARYAHEPLPQDMLDAINAAIREGSSGGGTCPGGHCDGDGRRSRSSMPAGEAQSSAAELSAAAKVAAAAAAEAAAATAAEAEALPAAAVLDISSIQQHLHLPAPNWAIPRDLSLRPQPPAPPPPPSTAPPAAAGTSPPTSSATATATAMGVPPAVASETPSLRLWHQQDTWFGLPKAHLRWHLVSPCVYATPHSVMAARLLVRVLEDLLMPETYHAELAGSHWELSTATTGLLLHVSGFSDVVGALQARVLAALAHLSERQVQDRFETVVGRQRQALLVWQQNNPVQHAEYAAQHLLQAPHWHVSQLLAVLEGVSAQDVLQLCQQLRSQVFLEGLAYGNLTAAEAAQLAEQVQQLLQPCGLGPESWPQPQVLALGSSNISGSGSGSSAADRAAGTVGAATAAAPAAGSGAGAAGAAAAAVVQQPRQARAHVELRPGNPNPSNRNHALWYQLQLGPACARLQALLELFVQVASKPCFHQLRTRERLGYSVACTASDLQDVVSLVVRVQSPADKPPALLKGRVAAWLAAFRSQLEALGEQQLQDFKTSLIQRYLEPSKSLSEAARRPWAQIRSRRYEFDRRQQKAAAVAELELPHLLHFYDTQLAPGAVAERLLCVLVQGGVSEAEAGEGAETGAAGVVVLDDAGVAGFQSGHARYQVKTGQRGPQAAKL